MAVLGRNVVFIGMMAIASLSLWRYLCPTINAKPEVAAVPVAATDIQSAALHLNQLFTQEWQGAGISAAEEAPWPLVARRISLALAGTIPSLEELRQLEALPAAQRLDQWVDQLLRQDRCSAYLAERIARTLVGVRWEPPAVFRRDMFVSYLKEQIRAQRPYDELVREMIVAKGNSNDAPSVNFLTSTCDVVTFQGPDPAKAAGRVAQAFVGVNLECAECHDHPFEMWTQQDFRSLAAFFEQTSVSFSGMRDSPNFGPDQLQKPSALFAAELLPEFGPRRERLAAWITSPQNRAFPRTVVNRVWTFLFGRPLTGTFSEISTEETPPAPLEFLVDDFVQHDYSLDRLIRVIIASRPFRLDSRLGPAESPTQKQYELFAAFPMTPLRPEQWASAGLQSGVLIKRDQRLSRWYRIFEGVQYIMFRNQYGDLGPMEFNASSTSVPQKLLTMNGSLVDEVTRRYPGSTTAALAMLEHDNAKAIDLIYLCTLTRKPTAAEEQHFLARLSGTKDEERRRVLASIHWALLNSTEFAWNH